MPVFRKDERKFLFVHVPKTGGSSIEQAFKDAGYDTLYKDGRMGPKSWNHVRRCTPQHMHRDILETLFRLERFDGIFMVVRDPLSRLRSEYLWRHRNQEDLTVDEQAVQEWAAVTFARAADDPFLFDNHIRPQADFLVEGARTFRLEDGLDAVATALNEDWDVGLPAEVPRVREGHTTTTYSSRDVEVGDKLRRLVGEFYREDFARFGYTVGPDDV